MCNHITRFINFCRSNKKKGSLYLFVISNANRSSQLGTHWWSILDIHPSKQLFLFDSYDFTGFKTLMIHDNKNIINKILYGINKFSKKDNIFTLISLKFSLDAYQNLNRSEIKKLSAIAADVFNLINEFGKIHNTKNEIVLCLIDDQLQESTFDSCGIF